LIIDCWTLFFVLKLFLDLLPEVKHLLNTLKKNRSQWSELLEQEKRASLLTQTTTTSSPLSADKNSKTET
jgi:type II secretory pathway component PulL